jgi:hypothetical protein
MPAIEFFGKTEGDIEIKFRESRDATVGKVRIIKRHPIEQNVPIKARSPSDPPHGKTMAKDFADQFSMIVEYEIVTTEKKRQPKRGRKRQGQ